MIRRRSFDRSARARAEVDPPPPRVLAALEAFRLLARLERAGAPLPEFAAPRVVVRPVPVSGGRLERLSRDAGPSARVRVLDALVAERRALLAREVAELADVSETTARRELAALEGRHEVEHAEGARGMAGALVVRRGSYWEATHLAHELARCELNRAGSAELAGELAALEAERRESAEVAWARVAELEALVQELRARELEAVSFDPVELEGGAA